MLTVGKSGSGSRPVVQDVRGRGLGSDAVQVGRRGGPWRAASFDVKRSEPGLSNLSLTLSYPVSTRILALLL